MEVKSPITLSQCLSGIPIKDTNQVVRTLTSISKLKKVGFTLASHTKKEYLANLIKDFIYSP